MEDEDRVSELLSSVLKKTHLENGFQTVPKSPLARSQSHQMSKHKSEDEEDMPDQLNLRVLESGTSEALDCVCEVVGQDKTSKHYECRYQMAKPVGSEDAVTVVNDPDSSTVTVKPAAGQTLPAGVIEGKFAIKLPYVLHYHGKKCTCVVAVKR